VLGVENYGIYNVVGGAVTMFSVISGSLSNSISRFITFELGRKDFGKLQSIFSTSVNFQIILSIIIILLGETLGVWFLNAKMDIPETRTYAANWVLQCSLLSFCVGLISVPYNALIIAHEKMSAFAYISIVEVSLKLLIVFALYISSFDKLILYSILNVLVAVVIRMVYGNYAHRHFDEAKYTLKIEPTLFKEISSFAGWSFLTNAVYLFNTHGMNILMNIFFGVTVNAAKGIATQVESAVMSFVNNFTMALNPQIIKSYAAGEYSSMNTLICRGAKFSFFLMLIFTLPIMLEADYILKLWLGIVPEYTIIFIRLSFTATLINLLGGTGYTACMATGNIKKYTITITSACFIVFPISWILYKFGFPPYASYLSFIVVYTAVIGIRLFLMKQLLNFPPMLFIRDVIYKVIVVTLVASIVPLLVNYGMNASFLKFVCVILISVLSTVISIYFLGLSKNEQAVIQQKAKLIKNKLTHSL
jgi:O-antigen/teichoic acid export membrane protein